MLNLIMDSYKSFFKKMPTMLLFILPLLAYSFIEVYCEGKFAQSQIFIFLAVVLTALVNVLTEIALYKYNLAQETTNPLKPWYNIFIYYVAQMLFGLVIAIPAFILTYIFAKLSIPYAGLLAWALNIFLGISLWARLNVLLPMVISGEKITLKDFMQKTSEPYHQWLLAATCIYLPYIAINYLINNPWLNTLLLCFTMMLIVVFNSNYLQSKK